jgi:hypothetical protein
MKRSLFTESKVISILRQYEGGLKVGDIFSEHGIARLSSSTGEPNTAAPFHLSSSD